MTDKTVEENKEEPVSASASKHSGKRLPRKRLILLAAILAVVVAVLWYGIDWWMVGRFIEKTDDAYVGGNVTVISPHVSGYVAEVLVRDNQFVQKGQPLIRLESQDYKALLDAASALVAERKAALNRLHAQRDLEKALIRKAEADLDAKNASAEFNASEAERYHKLAQTQAGTQQNAERSRSASHETRAEADAGTGGSQAGTGPRYSSAAAN